MPKPLQVSIALTDAADNNICASQSPGAGAILINGLAATAGVATLDTARRVLLTSGGNDSTITFTVTGTNLFGNALTETITGGNGAPVYTTQDFKKISAITHTGSVATTLKVGTNGIASSPWLAMNFFAQQFEVGIAVVVTGTVGYTVEYTYDDPNNPFTGTFPTAFAVTALSSKSTTLDGSINEPVYAARLTQNSFSSGATLKAIFIQAGDGA